VFTLGVKLVVADPCGSVLLLKVRSNCDGVDVPSYWDIPGGRLHRGEGLKDALRRELWEETALKLLGNEKLVGVSLSKLRKLQDDSEVGLVLVIFRSEWPAAPPIQL